MCDNFVREVVSFMWPMLHKVLKAKRVTEERLIDGRSETFNGNDQSITSVMCGIGAGEKSLNVATFLLLPEKYNSLSGNVPESFFPSRRDSGLLEVMLIDPGYDARAGSPDPGS